MSQQQAATLIKLKARLGSERRGVSKYFLAMRPAKPRRGDVQGG